MRLHKLLIPILVLLALTDCSGLFNNDSDGPELRLQTTQSADQTTTFNGDTLVFTHDQDLYDDGPAREYDLPEFTSESDNNQIVIHGYYLASGGFIPVADFDYEGNQITIRIHMDEDEKAVPSEPRGYFYDAYITNVSSGSYDLEIIHKNDLLRGKYGEEHAIFSKEFEVK